MARTCSRAAFSMKCFAFYVVGIGSLFLLFPEVMHSLANIEPPNVISRVFGLILVFLAYYYFKTARADKGMEPFFWATVHTRALAIFVLLVFMLLGFAGPLVVVFGLGDFAGAMWTFWALRRDAKDRATT